jgi:hypothetical protein
MKLSSGPDISNSIANAIVDGANHIPAGEGCQRSMAEEIESIKEAVTIQVFET